MAEAQPHQLQRRSLQAQPLRRLSRYLRAVPELAEMPPEAAGELVKRCMKRERRRWQFWWGLLNPWVFLIGTLLATFCREATLRLWCGLGMALGATAYLIADGLMKRRRLIQDLREELGGICLHCGYDLRASSDRCPECGTPIPDDTQHPPDKPQ